MQQLLLKMMALIFSAGDGPSSTPLKSSDGYCLLAVSLSAAVFSCSCAMRDSFQQTLPGRRNRAGTGMRHCVWHCNRPSRSAKHCAAKLHMTCCVSEMTRVPGGQRWRGGVQARRQHVNLVNLVTVTVANAVTGGLSHP